MRPGLLLFGASGQVGAAVATAAAREGLGVIALDRGRCDIADASAVAAAVADSRALLAVNAAAYTAVDRAEREPGPLHAANVVGPGHIARSCARAAIPLIHLSTDYVFGGDAATRPWREDDPVAPQSAYAASKVAGEAAVAERLERHLILRLSGVFAPGGRNFVNAILAAAARGDRLTVVDDQVSCPTAAADIAAVIVVLARRLAADGALPWGLYHYRGDPPASWHDVAAIILEEVARCGRPTPPLAAIDSASYGAAARRPRYSVLDCAKIAATFGVAPAPWRPRLAAMVGPG